MRVFPRGHAGFMEALLAAERDLAAKRIARAIVGGVDSLVDPATVRWLHAARRLKAGDRPVGLFPGEGAAFTLLERSALPLSMGPKAASNPAGGPAAKGAVSILGTAITMESATQGRDAPCTGVGLGEAILRTRDELDDAGDGIGLVVSDMNGEPYRSEEIGYALTRALSFSMGPAPQGAVATSPRPQPGDAYGPPRGPKSPFRLWHAADAIGDTGAAAPAIALGMAARALVRGYARTTTALVLASSDDGLRGSFAVQLGTTKG
jgi:3-oxoacyl-[acyl-carrier-protein] synthase-1